MNPEISIVIVSYNVKDYLLACLQSIREHSENISVEIIIIDNNSTDKSIEEAKEKFPEINIIQNNYNAGFSKANNQGIRYAKGKYILLLNPDTEVKTNSITLLLEYAEKQKGNFIIAPKLINTDGSLQKSIWKYPNLFSLLTETLYLHTSIDAIGYTNELYNKGGYCDWASGAAILFRNDKQFIFDENLFWMDDVDFCCEAAKKGIDTIYFPGSEIIHHGGKSSADNSQIVIPNQIISKLKFWKKHKNFIYFITGAVITFFFILSRTVILLILSPFNKLLRKKLLAYFYAMKKYFSYCLAGNNSIS